MKQFFSVFWRFFVTWIGIVGGVASIYSIRNDIAAAFTNNTLPAFFSGLLRSPTFWLPALVSIPLVLVAVILRMQLRKRGNVSSRKFFRLFNPFVFSKVCLQIHRLEHFHQELSGIIFAKRGQNGIFQSDDFRDAFFRFLSQCKLIVDLSTGSDNAVHVKLFEHRLSKTNSTVSLKKAFLRAYARVPSRRECILIDQQTMRPRENSEVFRIIQGKPGLAANMLKNKGRYMSARFRHCSAYNHVFSDPEHFFLCNDIPSLVKQDRYFSTSEEFEKFYKSAAVFLINHHVEHGHEINHNPVWGIFVIDSFMIGVYEKFITKCLGGYIAHRCHGLFEYAEHVGSVRV